MLRHEGGGVRPIGLAPARARPSDAHFRHDRIEVGAQPNGLAVTPDAIWGNTDGTLTEIDPRARATRGDPIRVGDHPVGVAVAEGAVWVANNGSDTVSRVALR